MAREPWNWIHVLVVCQVLAGGESPAEHSGFARALAWDQGMEKAYSNVRPPWTSTQIHSSYEYLEYLNKADSKAAGGRRSTRVKMASED